jgi:hypothetical protein
MKKSVMNYFSYFVALIVFSLLSLATFAQEKGLDVDINVKKESEWYQQPWVWVIGAAVFVLLLVALLKGSNTQKE